MNKIIENIDDVKLLINKYEWLKDRAIDMIDDNDFDEIQNLEWSDDDLTIYYSTYCYGCYEYNITLTVPISWFLLNDEDLKKAKEIRRQEIEEARARQKEINEAFRRQAELQKERKEYERLKVKFEGGEMNGQI